MQASMTMHLSQCMIAVQDHSTQGGQPSQEAAADQLPSEPSLIQSFVCALYRNVSCKPLLVHMSLRPYCYETTPIALATQIYIRAQC